MGLLFTYEAGILSKNAPNNSICVIVHNQLKVSSIIVYRWLKCTFVLSKLRILGMYVRFDVYMVHFDVNVLQFDVNEVLFDTISLMDQM